jgi:hypothetical protein
MFKLGDHVQQSDFAGHEGRSGVVVGIKGDLVRIRWEDGHESSLIPGPGSLRVLATPSDQR